MKEHREFSFEKSPSKMWVISKYEGQFLMARKSTSVYRGIQGCAREIFKEFPGITKFKIIWEVEDERDKV